MPWLVRDKNKVYESDGKASSSTPNILFVHIPRCGGTSLIRKHNVPSKTIETANNWCHRCGMRMFFYNYHLWELANFPIFTRCNAYLGVFVLLNAYLRYSSTVATIIGNDQVMGILRGVAGFNMAFGMFSSAILSVIFVAPNFGRVPFIRKAILFLAEYFFLRLMVHDDCMTGIAIQGSIPHLTAHKMLQHGYITPHDFHNCMSLAIVRNPYARMVSVYMYNRYGNESFKDFVKSWHEIALKHYRTSGIVDEWETPSHAIPQFEFTHFDGVQLVHAIVKQEEIQELSSSLNEKTCDKNSLPDCPPLYDLPFAVKESFLGLPKTNERKTPKPWYDYYDQETLNLIYDVYKLDFAIFGYSKKIAERPDLQSPPGEELDIEELGFEPFSRNVREGTTATKRTYRRALLTKASKQSAYQSSMGGFQEEISDIRTPQASKKFD